jgi:D-xylose 1-dehydrogenase (NADP+, D-xylono-1,5-lactone-forming)
MPDKVRLGILSTADIGRGRVIPALRHCRNLEVTAVASRSLEKAQAFATDMGIPKAYGSYDELIAAPDVDAIYNPLPNSMHAEWSIKCAEAGKPTLCEKPLASDAAEAQTMVDAFARRNVLFAEAFMYRFHPQTQKVKQMLTDGAIGELHEMSAAFSFVMPSEDNIRLSKPLAGGSLMDIGCYCVNVMRLMTGEEPDDAKAIARIGKQSQVDETLSGVLSFPSGVVGHFDCSFRLQWTHMYELRGTEGRIVVEQGFVVPPNEATIIRHWRGDSYEEIKIPAANSYTLMAEDFADALLNKRPPKYLPQDGVSNMAVIDQLYASAGVR